MDVMAQLLDLMKSEHLPHAMAFAGPSGIGKRQAALDLATAAGCRIQDGTLLLVSPATSQIKLEQAKEITNFLSLRSLSKRRFVIIDEATSMNASFANAVLKILEEPPAGTHFIFITPAVSQLMPTIRSRLQTIRFAPPAGFFTNLEEWQTPENAALKEKATEALTAIAQGRRSALETLGPEIKEREQAEMAAKLFQQFFRDVIYTKENIAGIVHADLKAPLKTWSGQSKDQIMQIWQEAFALQQNIAGHLDKTLSFETFFNRTRKILEQPHASEYGRFT